MVIMDIYSSASWRIVEGESSFLSLYILVWVDLH